MLSTWTAWPCWNTLPDASRPWNTYKKPSKAHLSPFLSNYLFKVSIRHWQSLFVTKFAEALHYTEMDWLEHPTRDILCLLSFFEDGPCQDPICHETHIWHTYGLQEVVWTVGNNWVFWAASCGSAEIGWDRASCKICSVSAEPRHSGSPADSYHPKSWSQPLLAHLS